MRPDLTQSVRARAQTPCSGLIGIARPTSICQLLGRQPPLDIVIPPGGLPLAIGQRLQTSAAAVSITQIPPERVLLLDEPAIGILCVVCDQFAGVAGMAHR